MITTERMVIVGGAPRVMLLKSVGNSQVGIRCSGPIYVGGPDLSLANGFLIGAENQPLNLRNNDELWAMSTSSAVVLLIIVS